MRPVNATDFAQFAQLRADARNDSPEALRGVATQFEALMTHQMLKSMRAASLGDDVLGGEQTAFYQDMFDAQISQHLSAGRGLGIADVLVRQLRGNAAVQPSTAGRPPLVGAASAATRAPAPAPKVAAEAAPATVHKRDNVPSTPQDFVRSVLPHAERAAAELGIPARVLVAQAALETGWGRHAIRRDDGQAALNFFGIKADKRWDGERVRTMTHEYADGQLQAERADFRSYGSVGQAFDDYVAFLRSNPRYAQALRHGGDARRFVGGLQQAGYATDPDYAQKILRIAEGRTMKLAMAQAVPAPRTITV